MNSKITQKISTSLNSIFNHPDSFETTCKRKPTSFRFCFSPMCIAMETTTFKKIKAKFTLLLGSSVDGFVLVYHISPDMRKDRKCQASKRDILNIIKTFLKQLVSRIPTSQTAYSEQLSKQHRNAALISLLRTFFSCRISLSSQEDALTYAK